MFKTQYISGKKSFREEKRHLTSFFAFNYFKKEDFSKPAEKRKKIKIFQICKTVSFTCNLICEKD